MTDEGDTTARLFDGHRVLITGAHGFLGRFVQIAFEEAGADVIAPAHATLELRDPSAVDETRPEVALTIWDDQIDRTTEPWTMNPATLRNLKMWQPRKGNKERIRNIRFGLDRCEGWFHLIWIRAGNPEGEVLERRYLTDRRGHIADEDFNPVTGEFLMSIHQI